MTQTSPSAPAGRPERDVLSVQPSELRDMIRLTIDRELVDELDRRRGSVSRSEYAEMVLAAAMQRERPHLADDWTPERSAELRFARADALPRHRPLTRPDGKTERARSHRCRTNYGASRCSASHYHLRG
jgi:hypothetical protein